MTNTPYQFGKPIIIKPKDNDLTKAWLVEYKIWSERRQRLVKKRVPIEGSTVVERIAHGRKVATDLHRMLKKGVCIDPVQPTPPAETVEIDETVTLKTPLLQAIEVFLAYKKQTTKYNSWRTYRSSLRLLGQYLREKKGMKSVKLGDFHAGTAYEFLDHVLVHYQLTNRGHNNVKDTARSLFKHFCDRLNYSGAKKLLSNPFERIQDKRTITNKHTAFTDQQRLDFRQAAQHAGEEHLLFFIQFMYYTYLRPGIELRFLRIQDLKEDTIYINGSHAKNNTGSYVQIPAALEQLIASYQLRAYPPTYYVFSREGKPGLEAVGPDYFYHHHRRLLERLGWTDKAHDLYSWKHTGVIALWTATQNIRLIQQQCRHSTAAQTEDYLRDLGIIVRHSQIHEFPSF